VVLKPEALRARLLELEEAISRLEELRAQAAAAETDFRIRWAIERGLLLGSQIIFDVGNHVLSAHFGVAARDYEDILEQLARQGVLPGPVRESLRGLGGFRNLLAHDYLRLDPAEVRRHLEQAPQRFTAFALAVRRWLETL
jgi:uncharacterized protein YutE (UPF0331/DUF86 family)